MFVFQCLIYQHCSVIVLKGLRALNPVSLKPWAARGSRGDMAAGFCFLTHSDSFHTEIPDVPHKAFWMAASYEPRARTEAKRFSFFPPVNFTFQQLESFRQTNTWTFGAVLRKKNKVFRFKTTTKNLLKRTQRSIYFFEKRKKGVKLCLHHVYQ